MTFITFQSDVWALAYPFQNGPGSISSVFALFEPRQAARQRVTIAGFAWHALAMAIDAFYRVDVVLAGPILERCVHGLHGNAAIGQARVTGAARGARLLAVFQMARHTAKSFVDTNGCAIVSRIDL